MPWRAAPSAVRPPGGMPPEHPGCRLPLWLTSLAIPAARHIRTPASPRQNEPRKLLTHLRLLDSATTPHSHRRPQGQRLRPPAGEPQRRKGGGGSEQLRKCAGRREGGTHKEPKEAHLFPDERGGAGFDLRPSPSILRSPGLAGSPSPADRAGMGPFKGGPPGSKPTFAVQCCLARDRLGQPSRSTPLVRGPCTALALHIHLPPACRPQPRSLRLPLHQPPCGKWGTAAAASASATALTSPRCLLLNCFLAVRPAVCRGLSGPARAAPPLGPPHPAAPLPARPCRGERLPLGSLRVRTPPRVGARSQRSSTCDCSRAPGSGCPSRPGPAWAPAQRLLLPPSTLFTYAGLASTLCCNPRRPKRLQTDCQQGEEAKTAEMRPSSGGGASRHDGAAAAGESPGPGARWRRRRGPLRPPSRDRAPTRLAPKACRCDRASPAASPGAQVRRHHFAGYGVVLPRVGLKGAVRHGGALFAALQGAVQRPEVLHALGGWWFS